MKVFICSPYRAKTDEGIMDNIKQAQGYCREAALAGHNPFAPHLFYTYFLDDRIEKERNIGIKLGIEELRTCDQVWVYAADYYACSEGMKKEVLVAWSIGIPVIFKLA